MQPNELETQRRIANDGLNLIDQAVVLQDAGLYERANSAILGMNQLQRDFVETEMVRSGLLPDAAIQVMGRGGTFQSVDRDRSGGVTRQELDNYLIQQSREPAHRRNFVNEMVLNQMSQRMGDATIKPEQFNSFASTTLAQRTNYEQALREYDGISNLIRRRYPNQFSAANNRFEISAAESALRDDQNGARFLTNEQRHALDWMVANRDDLYTTRLGLGTLGGLATQYFSEAELQRQARRHEVNPDAVRRAAVHYDQTLQQMSRDGSSIEYRIAPGETLSDIATARLREGLGRTPSEQEVNAYVARVEQENNLTGRHRLNSGQTIRIPRPPTAALPPTVAVSTRPGGPR